jgi:hypothetical protein
LRSSAGWLLSMGPSRPAGATLTGSRRPGSLGWPSSEQSVRREPDAGRNGVGLSCLRGAQVAQLGRVATIGACPGPWARPVTCGGHANGDARGLPGSRVRNARRTRGRQRPAGLVVWGLRLQSSTTWLLSRDHGSGHRPPRCSEDPRSRVEEGLDGQLPGPSRSRGRAGCGARAGGYPVPC